MLKQIINSPYYNFTIGMEITVITDDLKCLTYTISDKYRLESSTNIPFVNLLTEKESIDYEMIDSMSKLHIFVNKLQFARWPSIDSLSIDTSSNPITFRITIEGIHSEYTLKWSSSIKGYYFTKTEFTDNFTYLMRKRFGVHPKQYFERVLGKSLKNSGDFVTYFSSVNEAVKFLNYFQSLVTEHENKLCKAATDRSRDYEPVRDRVCCKKNQVKLPKSEISNRRISC